MARAVRAGQMTPADELRALWSDSERLLANLKGDGAVVQLLENMDRIAELWPQFEAVGADLRPEAGRWETIQALTHKQAGTIVRELRPVGGLAALRERPGAQARSGADGAGGLNRQCAGARAAPAADTSCGAGGHKPLDPAAPRPLRLVVVS